MDKGKQSFVILIPGFPKDEADTTCLPLQQSFARSLKELYPHLDIIVLSFQYPYHKNKYKWFGIEVIPFSGINKGGLSRLLLRQKIYSTLKEIHQKNKITGLLSFWLGECAYTGKHFGDKYGIKHYCWLMGQDARKENKYPGRMKPTADELIALSDFIQHEFEKYHGIRPLNMLPPGIKTKEFGHLPALKDIDILAAGSLIPLKQYDVFLEIIAAIKKRVPSIKAMLIGDGPEKKKLEDIIIELGLRSNVSLAGELSHPGVLKQMQRAKIFLHTSSYEGFGVVCLEALHSGANVISFVKPMQQDIQNWSIADTKEDMIQKTLKILNTPPAEYKKITPFLIEDSVRKIMQLFIS